MQWHPLWKPRRDLQGSLYLMPPPGLPLCQAMGRGLSQWFGMWAKLSLQTNATQWPKKRGETVQGQTIWHTNPNLK
jgi:hypothetical protein